MNFGASSQGTFNNTQCQYSNILFGSNYGVHIGFNSSYGASAIVFNNLQIENDSSSGASNDNNPMIYLTAASGIYFSGGNISVAAKVFPHTRDVVKVDSTTASAGIVFANMSFNHGNRAAYTGVNSVINTGTNTSSSGVQLVNCIFNDPADLVPNNSFIIGSRPVYAKSTVFSSAKTLSQLYAEGIPISIDGFVRNGSTTTFLNVNTITPASTGAYQLPPISVNGTITSNGFSIAGGVFLDSAGAAALGNSYNGAVVGNSRVYGFSSTGGYAGAVDAAIARAAPAVIQVTNGSTGLGRIALDNSTPSASTNACTAQSIWADANYVYVCTASGAIKRAALSTF
jgi:hypothetical protein